MIKIAICDNEQIMLDQISKLTSDVLEKAFIPFEADTFLSGEELIQKLEQSAEYDIALLDIEMGEISGIDVAARLREQFKNKRTILIYISAYESRCKEVLYFNTMRFLSKPIDFQLFEEAIFSACKKIKDKKTLFSFKDVTDGHTDLNVNDIMYFEIIESHRVSVITPNKKHTFYGSIALTESQLSIFNFLKIHRSYLINFDYIKKMTYTEVTMENDMLIPIAPLKRKQIRQQYWTLRERRESNWL
ncbi:MAG: LytR/AlgR family response regulator transcription factor [Lachnospiraceae bacterium]